MLASRVFALSLISGMTAATILVVMNHIVAGPHISELEFEYINLKLAEGLYVDEDIDSALQMQRFWQIAFPFVMGGGGGVLIATAYIKYGRNGFIFALSIASAAWFSLYIMPIAKYPIIPDIVFDPVSSGKYATLFASYSAASGLAALGAVLGFAKTGKNNWYFGTAGVYLAIVAGLYAVFPDATDAEFYNSALLGAWRSASAAGMTAFWFTLGILAGALLEREEKKSAGRGI